MSLFRVLCSLLCFGAAALFATAGGSVSLPNKFWVFIGTYTDGKSKGIYRSELNLVTGKLSAPVLAAELRSPSFLAIHPNRQFLYAVNEAGDASGKPSGVVSALALDPKTGELKFLNQEPSGGAGPCHIVVDAQGKNALVANYNGGSAAVLPIGGDGKLGKLTALVQHKGSSVNKGRQEAAHAHSINLDRANRFAFVADLGLDKVLIYGFDPDKGTLEPNDPSDVALKPGAGPRHFAFDPSGRYAYVINELDSTITACTYAPKTGALTPIQTISTLPDDYKGETTCAEVVVHPSGSFLYGSNRGHDSIACYTIDQKTGKLTFVGHQRENIKTPRNFALDPAGANAVVANQGSDSLVVFRVNQRTGMLESTGNTVQVPAPVCVRMIVPSK
jgi:6-phosphogluconolactonase